jgi:hypothetical protein
MAKTLGQPLIIENRGGGGSKIGTEMVLNAPKDGYTILFQNVVHAILPTVAAPLNYDPIKSFIPISQATLYSTMMVVHDLNHATRHAPAQERGDIVATRSARGRGAAGANFGVQPRMRNRIQHAVEVAAERYFAVDVEATRRPRAQGADVFRRSALIAQDGRHAMRILRSYQPGESVEFRILRDHRTQTLTAKVPEREARDVLMRRIAPPRAPAAPAPPAPPPPEGASAT